MHIPLAYDDHACDRVSNVKHTSTIVPYSINNNDFLLHIQKYKYVYKNELQYTFATIHEIIIVCYSSYVHLKSDKLCINISFSILHTTPIFSLSLYIYIYVYKYIVSML